MNYGKNAEGVNSMTQIEPIFTKLKPMNTSQNAQFSPKGNNRIFFRIPAYSSSFMDTSRSFLSFWYVNTTTDEMGDLVGDVINNTTPSCKLSDVGTQALFDRIVVKSSTTGAVLSDIRNAHLLGKIFSLLDTDDPQSKMDQGDWSGLPPLPLTDNMDNNHVLATRQTRGIMLKYAFNTTLLSKHLDSFLPLHMMGGNGGFALDLELNLTPAAACMERIGRNADNATVPDYYIQEVSYNIALLKLDTGLSTKFNAIAQKDETIIVPYTTYTNHVSAITGTQNTMFVSDATTDLRRLYVVVTDAATPSFTGPSTGPTQALQFYGARLDPELATGSTKIHSYNFKIGNKHLYNEPVEEIMLDNTVSLNHFINAHYKGKADKPIYASRVNMLNPAVNFYSSNYESTKSFVMAGNFTYSSEADSGMTQGVSLAGLPCQAEFKFDAEPVNKVAHGFSECGFYAVIKNGDVSYVEVKDSMAHSW